MEKKYKLQMLRSFATRFSKIDRKILLILSILFLTSFIYLAFNLYFINTVKIPVSGGMYTEGLIGNPHFINPILAPANEVDRYITKLIYPSLLIYNASGEIVPYLATDYNVDEKGRIYDFFLNESAQWEDGTPITARDVVFTIKSIQDPIISSPLFRIWDGVKVEEINDKTVRFVLERPYAFFLQNTTLGIMPAHIWENVSLTSFALSEYNLKPVSGGPFKFQSIKKKENGDIENINLSVNQNFFQKQAFIKEIIFKFFDSQKQAISALRKNDIDGLGSLPFTFDTNGLSDDYTILNFNLPRYFALFINTENDNILHKQEIRQALLNAIDRENLISNILKNQAEITDSPISKSLIKYYSANIVKHKYDTEKALQILNNNGFNNETPLEISLTTVNDPLLVKTVNAIASDWKKININTNINLVEVSRLHDKVIRTRDYEIFLFGQALQLQADPFSLWHSSQRKYPGLNLTNYTNNRIDDILETLRETFDLEKQKELFQEFQQILSQDLPAIFLFSPFDTFIVNKKIKNIQSSTISLPEDRLNQITSWYINTKRTNKN